ncbi:radical SAM/SPASM domain-containing protein [Candidatus Harpocratesius sp.]
MQKWKIGWGITNACNMNCSFCYSKNERNSKEVSLAYLIDMIKRNHKYIDSINYGTGENTISKKWFEFLLYIYKNYPQIPQALTTNGSFYQLYKELDSKNSLLNSLSEIDISLDFSNQKDHNEFRGNNHAYEWVMKSAKICSESNITGTFVIMAIDRNTNLENIKKIFKIAKKFDFFVRINIFRPNAMQDLTPLKYSNLKNLIKYILQNHKIVSLSDSLFSALILNEEFKDASGITSIRILPNGWVTPSTYLIDKNWQKIHINELDLSKMNLFDFDFTLIPDDCNECELRDICRGGAIDRRFIWYGTLNERDPYCPIRNNDSISSWRKLLKDYHPVEGPEIHKGYLPTLIFKP